MSKLKHCTKRDAQKVLDFMIEFRKVLGLPHCWISVKDKPAPDDALAMIEHEEQRQYASVYLGRTWKSMSEFDRFHAAVHETLHMIHRRVETVVIVETEHLLHDYEHATLQRNFNREIELMVDQLTLAWCDIAEVRALWYGDDADSD